MRVLFVYKYLTLGGVESVLRARLEALPAQGVEARAWFLNDGEGRAVFRGMDDRVGVGGVEALRQSIHRSPPDVVSLIDTPEALPALEVAGSARLVVEAHSPYLENLEYLRSLDRRGVAAVWAPTVFQSRVAGQRLGRDVQVQVVPNPLRATFITDPAEFEPTPPRPIVAWVGRLDALKNWKGFLSIGGRVLRADPEAELWMAGDSPEPGAAAALFRAAVRLGVAGRLFWFRSLPHERAPTWLDAVRQSGGVLISTSRGESFGMAVAEAMARGCPVVAPGLAVFGELIRNGEDGLLYRPASAADAAAAVRRFLASPALRRDCGARARAAVLARHAPQAAIRSLIGALEAVSRGGAAPPAPIEPRYAGRMEDPGDKPPARS